MSRTSATSTASDGAPVDRSTGAPAGVDRPAAGVGRPAAFFDLDKTVIASSAATAFARPFVLGGLLTRRAALRSAGAQIAFLLGGATEGRTERVRAQLSAMVAGWDVERVSAIVAANLDAAIRGVLHAEAVELVGRHHAAGHDVVIVSASSEELVRPVAGLIGADEVIASRMAVADGRYTGEIAFYAYGPAKAEAMRELARRRGYDLAASSAYTDSVTDVPMLEAVGHGFVVNPDRTLRRRAEQEGWTVLRFRRRVLLDGGRPGGARPGRSRLRAVVVAAVALGAVAAVLRLRARRRSGQTPQTGGTRSGTWTRVSPSVR
jgi:HAD superfamily hydrolase (TIGR01490 family)